eukprot:13063308-Ditylum_brightwellii.AAC.1
MSFAGQIGAGRLEQGMSARSRSCSFSMEEMTASGDPSNNRKDVPVKAKMERGNVATILSIPHLLYCAGVVLGSD